eukprot:95904-Prymnesium_polylepis.1
MVASTPKLNGTAVYSAPRDSDRSWPVRTQMMVLLTAVRAVMMAATRSLCLGEEYSEGWAPSHAPKLAKQAMLASGLRSRLSIRSICCGASRAVQT